MLTTSEIVRIFGGRAAVSELTGATPNAIRAWSQIGIPYRFWDLLLQHANDHNIKNVTILDFKATKPSIMSKPSRVGVLSEYPHQNV